MSPCQMAYVGTKSAKLGRSPYLLRVYQHTVDSSSTSPESPGRPFLSRQSSEHTGRPSLSFAASSLRSSLRAMRHSFCSAVSLGRNQKEGSDEMNLTEAQANALLEIGGAIEEHGYIPQRVLNDLMSYDLTYFNKDDEVEFTAIGKAVYDELAGKAGKGALPPPHS